MPTLDLGALHPFLIGCDAIQLACLALVSWMGTHALTQGDLRR